MPFSLTHLGAEHTVTGSCHLLRISSGPTILVDCGVAMAGDASAPFSEWPVAPAEIDYLFLTHAHIDHIGRVPDLIDAGFEGDILCSHPTKALLIPMLHDVMGFSHRSADEVKRLEAAIDELSWGFEYQESFRLNKGGRFKFGRAGHTWALRSFSLPCRTATRRLIASSFQEIWAASDRPSSAIRTRPTRATSSSWSPPTGTETTKIGASAWSA